MTTIYDLPLSSLGGKTLDFSSAAEPCRFRFIDCTQFVKEKKLRVVEMAGFPKDPYCPISYVWQGNTLTSAHKKGEQYGSFAVRSAEDGDRVGVEALMQACKVALRYKANYVWLDRVSMMQASKEDKAFQIRNMYRIYKDCTVCLVLPGGIRALVGLDEETYWIHRGWTLQEVVAPRRSVVLFTWPYGSGEFQLSKTKVHQILPKRSAYASLRQILELHTSDRVFTDSSGHREHLDLVVRMFGSEEEYIKSHVWALLGAMQLKNPEAQRHAVWRSAMLRTSSRPVDMVFSIMGMFGVSLDSKSFKEDDRGGATIALAREILRKGGSANWLGMSFHLPPSKEISSFPLFPTTAVAGKANLPTDQLQGLVRVRTSKPEIRVEKVIDGSWPPGWYLDNAPKGSMDSAGYFAFSAKSTRAVFLRRQFRGFPETANMDVEDERGNTVIAALDGSFWKLLKEGEAVRGGSRAYAVFVGNARLYGVSWISRKEWADGMKRGIVVMFIEEHSAGEFARVAFAFLGDRYKPVVETWKSTSFSLGGHARK